MSIVKRKDSAGRTYYISTVTGKRSTEASYKRSKAAPLVKHQARPGGKPSLSVCSTAGKNLKKKHTSSAGKTLRRCQ